MSNKRKTTEQFVLEAARVHANKYDYTETVYLNAIKKVKISCPDHGEFFQRPNDHLGGHGCAACLGMKTLEQFRAHALLIHDDRYCYESVVWKGASKKIAIKCQNHGIFWMLPTSHIRARQGCPKCGGKQMNTEEWLRRVKSKRMDFDQYDFSKSEYTDFKTKITIICIHHGIFSKKPSQFYKYGCPKCTTSGHHSKIEHEWLDLVGIDDICRNLTIRDNDGRVFYVDGYDAATKTVYEFYGDYWHGNPNVYERDAVNPNSKTTFGKLYDTTMDREKYLRMQGYNVISIWENEFMAGRSKAF